MLEVRPAEVRVYCVKRTGRSLQNCNSKKSDNKAKEKKILCSKFSDGVPSETPSSFLLVEGEPTAIFLLAAVTIGEVLLLGVLLLLLLLSLLITAVVDPVVIGAVVVVIVVGLSVVSNSFT